jgi:hypothetical protein
MKSSVLSARPVHLGPSSTTAARMPGSTKYEIDCSDFQKSARKRIASPTKMRKLGIYDSVFGSGSITLLVSFGSGGSQRTSYSML